jgi:hypothetical protein
MRLFQQQPQTSFHVTIDLVLISYLALADLALLLDYANYTGFAQQHLLLLLLQTDLLIGSNNLFKIASFLSAE